MTLDSFISIKADEILRAVADDFVNSQMEHAYSIGLTSNKLKANREAFQENLKRFIFDLQSFVESTKIDDNFVR